MGRTYRDKPEPGRTYADVISENMEKLRKERERRETRTA